MHVGAARTRGLSRRSFIPRLPGFAAGDLVAGVSVALVLIPQSLAYAHLAGLPPVAGLYAGALPAIVAAVFASSPWLATGPAAIVSLLTFTSLSGMAEPFSEEYVGLALLLSLMVGAIWLAVGLLRAGVVAYLMSQPMLMGFIPAAALVILGSQLPAALGASPPEGTTITEAAWALVHIDSWALEAVLLSIMVLVCMFGGKRVHMLFPGVLVAAALGILFSHLTGYSGTKVGEIPVGGPPVSFDFPLGTLPSLLLPAVVIALVGFAEAGSIARTFAARERRPWNSNREFVSQGLANMTSGVAGGYPVCGSFSRTAVNHLSGAQSRWSGAVTGLVVLAFLPAATVLEPLPKAVLAGIIIGAVSTLIRPLPILRMWRYSRPQFVVAATTFVCTLAFSEHVDYALLIGISVAIMVHLWREMRIDLDVRPEGETLHLTPRGVLWYGGAKSLEEALDAALATHAQLRRLELHLEGLGRIDVTGALALRAVVTDAKTSGLSVTIDGVPEHARRLVTEIVEREEHPFGEGH